MEDVFLFNEVSISIIFLCIAVLQLTINRKWSDAHNGENQS